ncbi:MAG TPA: hypothetical protein VMW67_08140 [Desulfobacteria bacterium]|nr:hypothetical protein [Desulfobacteria bacterium]
MIEGKIAKILSEYRVVINRGHKDGVENGMRFVIFDPGEEIRDPDTKEPLGTLEILKAKVEVINVQEKLSTARTYENEDFSTGPFGALVALERGGLKKLPLDEKTIEKVIIAPLAVGNRVRQILD